jgi:hypothetical protein
MEWFGLKMDFLCILQVSRFVFVLKTNFHNYFTVFNLLWTGRQFLDRSGGLRAYNPRLSEQCMRTAGFPHDLSPSVCLSRWSFSHSRRVCVESCGSRSIQRWTTSLAPWSLRSAGRAMRGGRWARIQRWRPAASGWGRVERGRDSRRPHRPNATNTRGRRSWWEGPTRKW